jgi:predicted lipid-binding transport protein (Tim44 family)
VRIAQLDAAAEPPTIAVELRVAGRRYVEDRDTAEVVSGSREREVAFSEQWTLALDGNDTWPWRIAAAGVPAR